MDPQTIDPTVTNPNPAADDTATPQAGTPGEENNAPAA